MPSLLIATNNPGKRSELQALFAAIPLLTGIDLLLPADLGIHLDVVEDAGDYAGNAAKKTAAFCAAASAAGQPMPTLADDSGLEVDALGGAPGVHSHRYGGLQHGSDADRRAHLLKNLLPHPRPWSAHFHCTVAISVPDSPLGQVYFAEGNCPGEIIPDERGSNGFGYDPIFLLPELGRTMAQLSMDEKNRLSHRGRAVQAAADQLNRLLFG